MEAEGCVKTFLVAEVIELGKYSKEKSVLLMQVELPNELLLELQCWQVFTLLVQLLKAFILYLFGIYDGSLEQVLSEIEHFV